jgi:hypothetical protein
MTNDGIRLMAMISKFIGSWLIDCLGSLTRLFAPMSAQGGNRGLEGFALS